MKYCLIGFLSVFGLLIGSDMLLKKPLGNDEHLIKSVWETEDNEPSPPKQKGKR